MLEELQVQVTNCSDVPFLDADRTSTPAWLVRLACAAHAAVASLAECCDLCEWFGVSRTRATIYHWYQSYADYYEQDFTADPDRIAVDEKQIQLAEEEKLWLYAAIDTDSKLLLEVDVFSRRGTDPASAFLHQLTQKHGVSDTEFLTDAGVYLTALARFVLHGGLNYSERNLIEKWFQTVTMRIDRFHSFWRGSSGRLLPSHPTFSAQTKNLDEEVLELFAVVLAKEADRAEVRMLIRSEIAKSDVTFEEEVEFTGAPDADTVAEDEDFSIITRWKDGRPPTSS